MIEGGGVAPKGPRRAPVAGLGGLVLGAAVGVPILTAGLLLGGRAVLPGVVPVLDAVAITCLLLTVTVAGLDAILTRRRQSLPILSLALATAVMWVAHLLLYPGDFPISFPGSNGATAAVFLAINLALPIMLAIALLQRGGPMTHPRTGLVAAVAAGLATGLAVTAIAIEASRSISIVTPDGRFNQAEAWMGGAGLVPAVIGLAVYLSGRRGDPRVSGGVVAALVLQACNSLLLPFLGERYTAAWHADHLLSALAPAALLAGQMVIFGMAMRRDQRSVVSLRTSLEMAETLARQVDLGAMIDKLMEGAMAAVGADRATLMTLEAGQLQIEASIDRRGTPGPAGRRLPVTALQVDGMPIVPETIRTGRPIATAAYETGLLDEDHAQSVGGIRHYVTWPLFLGGEADAILFLGRRDDVPFDAGDTELLSEFATIAALLLRNARLLRAAEAASVAKSSFLNLAGHELRTPLSVIRGYLELLAGGDLGPVPAAQAAVMQTLQAKSAELADQVDELLEASRLEGQPPVEDLRPAVALRAACLDAIARARSRRRLGEDRIELVPGDDVCATASPSSLSLVLDKLIDNALTYSRTPARVSIEVDSEGGPRIRLSDAGIGIPADHRALIFDRFNRVDRPDFAYPGGIGLGLYLARQHAAAMGATLDVEWSEVDAGSTFSLRLRQAPPEPGSAVPVNPDPDAARGLPV